MEFETLRESSILAGSDAVEHSSIAKNWTTDMQQSFPYQHKNVLEMQWTPYLSLVAL